ncbi:ciliogenesis and planar polarity effector 2 isoform X2 [Lepisosteus oculatus]|uniref:ciliogenesis and planar polarity effector 2 isoform X2 n=1 Tax=Lepisosteus oculatus TaxID=7918 RepID=UPI0037136F6E
MDPTPVPGSLVVLDWHRCADSKEHFSRIQRRNVRKRFGLLEAPVLRPLLAADTVSYKIFLSGKSGVGKTALAARLAGLPVPSMHHETTGVQTTVVFWPVKLRENGRVLFFRLQLWDCGENTLRRFDHLLPACTEQADAVLSSHSCPVSLSLSRPVRSRRTLSSSSSPSRTAPPSMTCPATSRGAPVPRPARSGWWWAPSSTSSCTRT